SFDVKVELIIFVKIYSIKLSTTPSMLNKSFLLPLYEITHIIFFMKSSHFNRLNRKGSALVIKRFFSYYKPHRRLFIVAFSIAVIVALIRPFLPIALQWFLYALCS